MPKSVLGVTVINIAKLIIDLPFFIYLFITTFLASFINQLQPKHKKSLEDETILVTGAATGLGRHAVLRIAKETKKVNLILWDINEACLNETSEECRKLGAKVYPYIVDLTQRDRIVETAKKVRQEVGQVTILFNNAGLSVPQSFLEGSPTLEDNVIKVNLMSYLWTMREFLPDMVQRGKGQIVSSCSGLALFKWINLSSYVASKYGLRGFIDTLKLEMKNHPGKPDIKFTTIFPGWVKTPMTERTSWTPRYELSFLMPLDAECVAERIVEGIQKEMEEVMIPQSLKYLDLLRFLPSEFVDSVQSYLYSNFNNPMSPALGKVPENYAKEAFDGLH